MLVFVRRLSFIFHTGDPEVRTCLLRLEARRPVKLLLFLQPRSNHQTFGSMMQTCAFSSSVASWLKNNTCIYCRWLNTHGCWTQTQSPVDGHRTGLSAAWSKTASSQSPGVIASALGVEMTTTASCLLLFHKFILQILSQQLSFWPRHSTTIDSQSLSHSAIDNSGGDGCSHKFSACNGRKIHPFTYLQDISLLELKLNYGLIIKSGPLVICSEQHC